MASSNFLLVVAFVFCGLYAVVKCEDDGDMNPKAVEEGRTLVHHAMKRLSLLLPAFMFKLGIMFTMILVSMITSTKGLLVGTLLLALGVGHFIASKFSAVNSSPVTAHLSLPHYGHYPHAHLHAAVPHILERSDNVPAAGQGNLGAYPAQYGQYAQGQAYSAWKQ